MSLELETESKAALRCEKCNFRAGLSRDPEGESHFSLLRAGAEFGAMHQQANPKCRGLAPAVQTFDIRVIIEPGARRGK